MQYSRLSFFHFSWACVGITESDSSISLESLRHESETVAEAVERYIKGYLAMWNVAHIATYPRIVPDHETRIKAEAMIQRYIKENPPITTLPRFYIVLYKPKISGNGYSLSNVFRM